MKSDNRTSGTIPLSRKRREDVTIEELKNLPCFAAHSDEELAAIIEAAKVFSRAVVAIHVKETANKKATKKSKTIELITNPQKKAA